MGFFNSESKRLPKRGRNRMPLRGAKGKRLARLRQFDVGRLYTFEGYYNADRQDDLKFGVLIEEIGNDHCERHYA